MVLILFFFLYLSFFSIHLFVPLHLIQTGSIEFASFGPLSCLKSNLERLDKCRLEDTEVCTCKQRRIIKCYVLLLQAEF